MKRIDSQIDLRVFTSEETKKDWICAELKFIVHHHHNLLQLHKLAQKLLSSIFLALLMGIAFDLVLIGTWMVILLDEEVIGAVKMIMAFLIIQFTVFTMCIPSQLMSNASYDLFVRNYSTNWYKYPPQARSMLVLLIAGTARNFEIKAGPIFIMTFETCSSLMKLLQELKKDNVDSNTVVECALQISVNFRHIQGYIFISTNFDKVLKCFAIMNHIFQNNSELGQKIIMHRVDKALNLSTLQSGRFSFFYIEIEIYEHNSYRTFSVAFILMCISYVLTPLAFQTFLSWIFPEHYMKRIDYELDLRVFTIEETKKNWICAELKFIIHHHHNLLQLRKLAQKLLSSIFLVLLMGIAFDLVLIGTWMVILLDEEVIGAVKMIMAFLIVQLTVFTMCFPSQLMSNASYDLFVQNYSTNWYKYPPQARRMLVLLIAGTARNFEIKAGPIFILTFETCSCILKGSMSYIATFKTMYASFQ
uniref:Odorant receptor n=1 Tax=Trichogramma kaykai TaxID=54128 RepID=A0ABD2XRX0_9HYME